MHRDLHRLWFNVAALVVGAFGPVFFLGAAGFAEAARFTLDLLSWPVDGNMSYKEPTTRFLSALTGGFLLGWSVTIWYIGEHLYPVAPRPARKAVVYGMLAWFFLDSAGSALSGNEANILFNIAVLLTAVGPLWTASKAERADDVAAGSLSVGNGS
jgi:hypothetical protein